MKKLFAAITIATSFLCASTSYAQTAETYTEQDPLFNTPFTSYENANMPYRIPAIVQTTNNAILVFADKRHDGGDVGQNGSNNTRIDLVYKKSLDYGKTWSKEKCLIEGQSNYGYGDAAVVSDREDPNKILVMCAAGNTFFTKGKLECHKFRSNDGGENWIDDDNDGSPGIEVTSKIYDAIGNYTSAFFSSGRICQSSKIKVGSHYRLYAALCVTGTNSVVIYSDDFGESWSKLGGSVAVSGGNEAKCEELPNGNVLVSSRAEADRYFNVFTYTDKKDAKGSWGNIADGNLEVPEYSSQSTNGEILIVPAYNTATKQVCNLALQSMPYGAAGSKGFIWTKYNDTRTHVSIYYKELSADESTSYVSSDFSSGWTRKEITSNTSAYSSMILQGDGNIGFVYEDNYDSSLGTGGYDIKYKNLTLSEITGGAYSSPQTLTLDETQTWVPIVNRTYGSTVTVNRTIKPNTWFTFVVPFDIPSTMLNGWEIKELTGSELVDKTIMLNFSDAKDGIKAGVPYIVRNTSMTETLTTISMTNVNVNTTALNNVSTDLVTFVGTYTNGYVPEGAYFISGNKFYRAADATNTMKGYRAYFTINENAGAKIKGIGYKFDDDATEVESTTTAKPEIIAVYGIDGTLREKVGKGLNIVKMSDGTTKKVFVK